MSNELCSVALAIVTEKAKKETNPGAYAVAAASGLQTGFALGQKIFDTTQIKGQFEQHNKANINASSSAENTEAMSKKSSFRLG